MTHTVTSIVISRPKCVHQLFMLNHCFLPLSILAPGLYTCSMTLQPMSDQRTRVLSMSMTNLLVKAGLEGSAFSGEQVSARLPIEPGLYSDQTELLLSNLHPSVELTVYGPTAALSNMEVSETTSRSFNKMCNCYISNSLYKPCLSKPPFKKNISIHFTVSLGGIYFSQHCCPREGSTSWLSKFFKVHYQCCGPSGSSLCFYFHKQHFLRPESPHPSHFDSRGWS